MLHLLKGLPHIALWLKVKNSQFISCMLLSKESSSWFHLFVLIIFEESFTLPIEQIRKAGLDWLSGLPIQFSRDLLNICSVPGALGDRGERLVLVLGSLEGMFSKKNWVPKVSRGPSHPCCLSWIWAVCLLRKWSRGHWSMEVGIKKTDQKHLISRLNNLQSMTTMLRLTHFLTVTTLRVIAPRLLDYV